MDFGRSPQFVAWASLYGLKKNLIWNKTLFSSAQLAKTEKTMPRNKTQILLAVLTLLVIAAHLFYLWKVRSAVPHQDEWTVLFDMFRAIDGHHVTAWLFAHRNGHVAVPARLALLFSLKFFSLDLTPVRFVNFPICLAAFLLTAHVINLHARQHFLRFYLYLGAACAIFSLCLWEHFAQAAGFPPLLCALFAGIGLYYVAKSTQPELDRRKNIVLGIAWILGSILSFGLGYAAIGAAMAVLALAMLKLYVPAHLGRALPHAAGLVLGVFGLAAIVSHPIFNIGSRLMADVYHFLLVAGSVGAFPFDKNEMARNAGYFFGLALFGLTMWTTYDFVFREPTRPRLLTVFSLGFMLFGLLGCTSVAIARSRLPVDEFLSSRYTLYPLICFLGSLLYLVRARIFLLANVWCLVAVGYLFSSVKEQLVGRYRPEVYQAVENAMRNVDALSDEQLATTMYFKERTGHIRYVVKRLQEERLNIFRGEP
jgi:hypothetical protein